MKCVLMMPDTLIQPRAICSTVSAYVTSDSPIPPYSSGIIRPKIPSSLSPSTIAVGYSSRCSSSVATGRISLSTKARTVDRISRWMSVSPSVCARRSAISVPSRFRAAGLFAAPLLDVRGGRHQHLAAEDADQCAVLLVTPGLDVHDAAVVLRRGRPLVQHGGLAVDRVAVEGRRDMAQRLDLQVGDRLARHVRHRHAQQQRVDVVAHHHVPAEVRAVLGVVGVQVERVVIHGEEAEEMVVVFRDRLSRPVLVDRTDLELLVGPPEPHRHTSSLFASRISSTIRPMIPVIPKSFGVNTAATPAASSSLASAAGMMPPTTTGMSSTPARRSRSSTSGTSAACEPDRIDRPTQCTSSATAADTICSGVSLIPWYTTSKPASRARTAICSAPLECPSRPGLPTSSRSLPPPSSAAVSATLRRTSASSLPASAAIATGALLTPVGARNSPNTSRSANDHSPVVTPARAHSRVAAIRFSGPAAAEVSAASAAFTRGSSRAARHSRSAATTPASPAGSTVMIAVSRSAVSGLGSVDSYALTPTIFSWPDSIRARRSACEDTSCDFR